MNVLDAAHSIGHDYPGGVEALAVRMGIRPAVLRAKLNPNADTNHLTIKEAQSLQQLTGRRDIVIAMADELGGAFVELPDVADEGLQHAICRSVSQFGAYMQKIDEALADKKVTRNESKELASALIGHISRVAHIQAILQRMAEQ